MEYVFNSFLLAVDDTKVCFRTAVQPHKDQVWTLPQTSAPNANTIVCMIRDLLCFPSKGSHVCCNLLLPAASHSSARNPYYQQGGEDISDARG